jgi:hypothetical protein
VTNFDHLRAEFELSSPAAPGLVELLRRRYGPQVPEDYLEFLSAHDGAVGAIALLEPAAQVGQGSELHPELEHLHDLVVFGSDGAGEAFAFTKDGTVVMIPWIGNREDAVSQGSFTRFLVRLLEDTLFDP